jgi:hypothetical protein
VSDSLFGSSENGTNRKLLDGEGGGCGSGGEKSVLGE